MKVNDILFRLEWSKRCGHLYSIYSFQVFLLKTGNQRVDTNLLLVFFGLVIVVLFIFVDEKTLFFYFFPTVFAQGFRAVRVLSISSMSLGLLYNKLNLYLLWLKRRSLVSSSQVLAQETHRRLLRLRRVDSFLYFFFPFHYELRKRR